MSIRWSTLAWNAHALHLARTSLLACSGPARLSKHVLQRLQPLSQLPNMQQNAAARTCMPFLGPRAGSAGLALYAGTAGSGRYEGATSPMPPPPPMPPALVSGEGAGWMRNEWRGGQVLRRNSMQRRQGAAVGVR